ncbi:hypothetical protein, partial [uncultured Dialister sp.]|uniref:hypothetical protein n=1 Tax=uncultured Dialister sp. TaxID=278064 RepID=UPI0025EA157E
ISEKDDYDGVTTPEFREKNCILEHKKDFSDPRSCSGFDSRAIEHAATARNDGEWEKPSFRGTILAMVTLPLPRHLERR